MADKTIYTFGGNGSAAPISSRVVEYDCKAEMFLDNTKPIGTIAKVTDVYRYSDYRHIYSGEQVYGIMIQEGSLTDYGTCLTSTTSNNSIFIENSNGVIKIKDTVNGFYEVIDTTSTYLLDGDIYNLIKDGSFVKNSSIPSNETIRYKTKKGTGRTKYYVCNGHGWNVLKNTDLTKPTKLRIVHHCIPFGAKPGYLYIGKIVETSIFDYIEENLPNCYPAMKFKNVAGKTIDLSKLGIGYFDTSHDTSYHYSINTIEQTITFTNNFINDCWVILKKPISSSGNTYDKKRFGYYIDYDGKLKLFTDNNGTIEVEESVLTPITTKDEFLRHINFEFKPANFKNKHNQRSSSIPCVCGSPSVELQILETSTLMGRIRRKNLHRSAKWIKSRSVHPRHGGVRKLYKSILKEQGWNLLRVPKTSDRSSNFNSYCGIFRIRRTNKRYTKFSEWTYWKLYFKIDTSTYNNGLPNVIMKLANKLKKVYYKHI